MTNNNTSIHTSKGFRSLGLRGNSDGQKVDASILLDEALEYVTDSPFDLIERQKGGFTVFAPKGHINNATIKLLRSPLYKAADEPGCKIIINMRFVTAVDSVGLGVLITAHKMATARGGKIAFTDMNERIDKTMKMLYMDRYLAICENMKEAVELLSE